MFDPSWLDLFKKNLLTLNQLLISEPIFLYLEMVNLHNYYLIYYQFHICNRTVS